MDYHAHVQLLRDRYLMLYPVCRPLSQEEVRICLLLFRDCRSTGQSFTRALREFFIPTTRPV